MAQADGTIIIDTEIDADGMKAGSKEVEAAVRKMADSVNDMGTKAKAALNKQVDSFVKLNKEFAAQSKKVDELKKKVAEYGGQKIPTEEYQEIQMQIEKARKKLDGLIALQERFLSMGGNQKSNTYKRYQYDIDELSNTIRYAEGELRDLEQTGKAFTFGSQTKQAASDMEKLAAAERKLSNMNNRLHTSYSSIKGTVNDYNNNLLKTDKYQKRASASSNKLGKSLKNTGKAAKSANFGIGKMLGTSILFSFVFQAIGAATNAIKDGFTNLAQYSGTTNNSISMLWSSLERLKNSLATAFAPILDVVAPILSRFIDMLSTAASYVSMFFAFLSGKDTYTKAVAVQKDYAASLEDTSDSMKDQAEATEEAADAANGYLGPLDEIERYSDGKNKGSSLPDTPSSGTGSSVSEGPLFEEVEITDIPILEKLKNILSDLFSPFKQAWEAEGQSTINAAKYAFSSLLELASSVGQSFMNVWTNGTGTQTLSLILQIVQNILTTVGNLAQRFNEAWNTNEIGTQIIQNIFDLLNIVLGTIERITGATADWAATLDFTPLLVSINGLLQALEPLTETIGSGLEWFWTNVLLPISGWTIQEAVPTFLNMLSSGIGVLNGIITALQPLGIWFWENFLQPLGQWTGELIITAMQTITELLTSFSNWITEHQETIQNLVIILGSFAAAWRIVTAATTLWTTVSTIAAGATTALAGAVAFLTSPVTIAIAIIGSLIAIGVLLYKNWDTISAKAEEVWKFVQSKFQEFDDFLQNIFATDWSKMFGIFGGVFEGFFKGIEDVWNSIKEVFNGIIKFIDGVFSGNWKQAWEGVKQIFKGIFDAFVGIAKAPFNLVIGIINSVLDAVESAQHWIADALSFDIELPDWAEALTGYSSFGLSIGYIDVPNIPYLASGAVIPPNREFLAVLGDQKNGNNIEAPEGLLRKIFREEAGNQQRPGGVYNFSAQINRRVLFQEMIEEAKMSQTRTGKNPFELA